MHCKECLVVLARRQERTHGAARVPLPPPPLWDLKNTLYSGCLPLNYAICNFEMFFYSFLLCGRTEEACRKSLRKVYFSHPTGPYTQKNIAPPLEKILGAPLLSGLYVIQITNQIMCKTLTSNGDYASEIKKIIQLANIPHHR